MADEKRWFSSWKEPLDKPHDHPCTQCGSKIEHLERWNHWCVACSDRFKKIEDAAARFKLTLYKKGKCVAFQHPKYLFLRHYDSLDDAEEFITAYSPDTPWKITLRIR